MTIKEARSAYYAQYTKFMNAANERKSEAEDLRKEAKIDIKNADDYNERAAYLELSSQALVDKGEEYMDYHSKVCEMECAYANMLSSSYAAEDVAAAKIDEMKCIQTAMRMSRGDIVPPEDEKKLMDYNAQLYMSAKQMQMFAREHEEDDSLWEDEEDKAKREDPMEFAGAQEAPAGAPDLGTEVIDVVESVDVEA